jgi:SAM-dependent methyltransferase
MRGRSIYNNDSLWKKYGTTPDYRERADAVLGLIPADIKNVLDIGCGTGAILAAIAEARNGIQTVGCDLSREALMQTTATVVRAGLPDIPFPDKSFDLVLCLEVLEHLPAAGYAASLRELTRLAGRYIIIGVPYRENILTKQVLCADCGRTSHADGHVRAYTRDGMCHLLQGFTVNTIVVTGVRQRRQSRTGMWLRQNVGGVYYRPELFACPYCGSTHSLDKKPGKSSLARKTAVFISTALTACKAAEPYWIITRYGRRDV